MAYEKKPDWPFNASCFGPPCDVVNGWAITEYKGTRLLHCGWTKEITQQFLHGGDNNCPGYPGGVCPHGAEAIALANKRWIGYFGGSGNNPDSGPFNNDCYNLHGMMNDRCNGYNCHAFPSRAPPVPPGAARYHCDVAAKQCAVAAAGHGTVAACLTACASPLPPDAVRYHCDTTANRCVAQNTGHSDVATCLSACQ